MGIAVRNRMKYPGIDALEAEEAARIQRRWTFGARLRGGLGMRRKARRKESPGSVE